MTILPFPLWPLAEHAMFGQNGFDASLGSVFVCINDSMPMGAYFFKSSFPFHRLVESYPRGRRMLVFSDSRQGAARLGPRLTRQHEIQLVRAAIIQCFSKYPVVDESVIQDLQTEIERLVRELEQSGLTCAQRQQKERKLAQARQEFTDAQEGGTMGDWISAMTRVPVLQELIDTESATKHEALRWQEKAEEEWKNNVERVYNELKLLLAREFTRPTQRQVSLETLGLAEVTYPGLDILQIPESISGILPTVVAREQLHRYWTPFLSVLC